MRLLVLTIDPGAGGSSISLINLLKGLKQKGAKIKVVIPARGYLSSNLDELQIEYEINKNLKASIWPTLKSLKDILLFFPRIISWRINYLVSKRKISSIVKSFSPDLIHSNVSVITEGYKVAKKQNIAHVWHIREYLDKDFGCVFFPTKNTRKRFLRDSPSIAITSELNQHYHLKNGRIIYNGIRSENNLSKISTKDNYYLYVGRVRANKGVSDLIEGFIKYKQNGGILKLKLAGIYSSHYYAKLKSILQHHNLANDVEFLGQRDDVDKLMKSAKALIVPSKYEAFGRITAEAMFNGCQVIGRNTGGTKEQMDLLDDFCGRKVANRFENIDELADTLLSVEKISFDLLERDLKDAQRFVKEFMSTEVNVENTYNYFCQVIEEKQTTDRLLASEAR